MHIAQTDIEITIGEYYTLDAYIYDEYGGMVNLSGYAARMPVRIRYGENGSALAIATGTFPVVTGNVATFTLTPSETALMPCVQGVYEVILTPTVGNPIVYLYGYANIGPSLI